MKKLLLILFVFSGLVAMGQAPHKEKFGVFKWMDTVYFNPNTVPFSSSTSLVQLWFDTLTTSPTYGKLVRKTAATSSTNIYNSNGTLTGSRTLSGSDTYFLNFDSVVLSNTARAGSSVGLLQNSGSSISLDQSNSSFGRGTNLTMGVNSFDITTTASSTNPDRVKIPSIYKTLTESSATTFLIVTVATGEVSGGEILVTIEANDGTDFQARTIRFIWTAVNKAGTLSIAVNTPEEINTNSSGTLTCTITAIDGGSGNISFQANAVSSLSQSVLRASCMILKNFGGFVTPQ